MDRGFAIVKIFITFLIEFLKNRKSTKCNFFKNNFSYTYQNTKEYILTILCLIFKVANKNYRWLLKLLPANEVHKWICYKPPWNFKVEA